MARPIMLVTALLLTAGEAAAQVPGDAVAGRRLAERWCRPCHAVDAKARRESDRSAPTFAEIARRPATTPLALQVFLQTPHDRMPNVKLTHDQIDDLTSYILGLKQE